MSLKFFFSRTTAQESKIFTSKNLYIVRILNYDIKIVTSGVIKGR